MDNTIAISFETISQYAGQFADRYEVGEPDECWNWIPAPNKAGRGLFHFNYQTEYAYRVSFVLHNQRDLHKGELVRHTCDNPLCVNPHHLLTGTQKDNMQDALARGRFAWGERTHCAVLNDGKVRDIRNRVAAGERQCDLAKEYGVHTATVSNIVKLQTWKHVTQEQPMATD